MCTSDENERAQVGELISDLVRDLKVSAGAWVCVTIEGVVVCDWGMEKSVMRV